MENGESGKERDDGLGLLKGQVGQASAWKGRGIVVAPRSVSEATASAAF